MTEIKNMSTIENLIIPRNNYIFSDDDKKEIFNLIIPRNNYIFSDDDKKEIKNFPLYRECVEYVGINLQRYTFYYPYLWQNPYFWRRFFCFIVYHFEFLKIEDIENEIDRMLKCLHSGLNSNAQQYEEFLNTYYISLTNLQTRNDEKGGYIKG